MTSLSSQEEDLAIKCGSYFHQIDMSTNNTTSNCEESGSCLRTYNLYVPSRLCKAASSSSGGGGVIGGGVDQLPLVFALHCFGGNANTMIPLDNVAEDFNFVLVRPQGIGGSWNSQYCCGDALQNNVDDIGFLSQIIDNITSTYTFISKELTYGVGWSNGGYMVTYAAKLFRGIAPISGYQYIDDLLSLTDGKPTAIFQHHSLNDNYVQFHGCCYSSSIDDVSTNCCCGISEVGADQCTSVTQAWDNWRVNINQCAGSVIVTTPIMRKDFEDMGVTCHYGQTCLRNTTLCVYDNKGHFNHPSFEQSFPMFDEIGHFFAKDACSYHGGEWMRSEKNCLEMGKVMNDLDSPHIDLNTIDGRSSGNGGGGGSGSGFGLAKTQKGKNDSGTHHNAFGITMGSFMLIGILYIYYRKEVVRKVKKRISWNKVPSSEPIGDVEILQCL